MGKKEKEVEEAIFSYLEKHNRPFGIQNVIDGLQGAFKRAQILKAFDALVDSKRITLKEFGKNKVYWLAQDDIELPDENERKRIKDETAEKRASVSELKNQLQTLQGDVSSLRNALTDEQIADRIAELKKENKVLQDRLDSLTKNAVKVSPEERVRVEKALVDLVKMWKKRKRVVADVVDQMCEGMGKKPAEVNEMIGIETDEEVGVAPPKKQPRIAGK